MYWQTLHCLYYDKHKFVCVHGAGIVEMLREAGGYIFAGVHLYVPVYMKSWRVNSSSASRGPRL